TNLTATVSGTQITLNWTYNPNWSTNFSIFRLVGANGTFTSMGSVGANVTTLVDSGLTAGTEYDYQVQAVNNISSSSFATVNSARPEERRAGKDAKPGNSQETLNWMDPACHRVA